VREDSDAEAPRFLPPEPAGPEPELSGRPAPEPPPPPVAPQQTYGYPPPPPGYAYPPQPQWGHPQQAVPGNSQAVTGFVFSVVGVSLLFLTAGLSTIVSLGCAITGIVCSRIGKRKVDAGETPKHRGLAQAGFIIGWVGLGLSILAIIGWILVLAIGGADDGFRIDPEETRRAAARVWG
jgi:hypothetical protein